MKQFIFLFLFFFTCLSINAQNHETDSIPFLPQQDSALILSYDTTAFAATSHTLIPELKPRRDWGRLGICTGMYVGFTVVAFGILWASPESFSNWDKEDIKENGVFNKWKQNVKAGPVMDEDDFFLNYVTHPLAGGIYYMTARTNNFSMAESFVYSALMSTLFWEYGVEAFAEVPSWQDLIVTPVIGSAMGEGFHVIKKAIQKNHNRILGSRFAGETIMFLVDPFNQILDWCGYRSTNNAQANFAPVGINRSNSAPVWGINFSMNF
jgi:hypothetical protein